MDWFSYLGTAISLVFKHSLCCCIEPPLGCCFNLVSIFCYLFRKLLPYFNLEKNIFMDFILYLSDQDSEIWKVFHMTIFKGVYICVACITSSTRIRIFRALLKMERL